MPETVKIPPLIRSAKLIAGEWGAMHVDNFTGAIVHDTKVERALAKDGRVPIYYRTEDDELLDNDAPVIIKRSHGGPKINPVLLDAFTASMIVQVWDAISEENKAKFPSIVQRFAVVGTIDRLWKIVRRH